MAICMPLRISGRLIPTDEGWLYLAAVIDLFSRRQMLSGGFNGSLDKAIMVAMLLLTGRQCDPMLVR